MPGVQSIKWTDDKMAQALHAFIGYGVLKIDDDIAEKVAAHLGDGCTPTAIHNLIRTRRYSFKPGVLPAPPPSPTENTPTKGRKRKVIAIDDSPPPAPKRKSRPHKNRFLLGDSDSLASMAASDKEQDSNVAQQSYNPSVAVEELMEDLDTVEGLKTEEEK